MSESSHRIDGYSCAKPDRVVGVYAHIPFCVEKCDYCSFHSVPFDINTASDYLSVLLNEIASAPELRGAPVDTVYFGGGTPSLLDPREIESILSAIGRCGIISADAEITLETNPAHFSRSRFAEYAHAGVNRVSCGVQTLDPHVYRTIGRKGGYADSDFLDQFSQISQRRALDIMIGAGKSEQTLRELTQYPVNHFSAYILSLDEGTPLAASGFSPDEALQCVEYRKICEVLSKYKFDHYEISNFARSGEYSRHNLKYWNFEEYVGFGAGAHSFYGNIRWANELLGPYLASGGDCRIADSRTADQSAAEFIMTKLRLRGGFALDEFAGRFNGDQNRRFLAALDASGYDILRDGRVALSEEDFLFLDEIISRLADPFV